MLLIDYTLRGKITKEFSISTIMNKTGLVLSDEEVKLESNAKGQATLLIHTPNGWNYLHSKYDPQGEASRWVDTIKDLEKYSQVFFYGIGLGYHIKEFTRRYPQKKYSMYEPNISILKQYMSMVSTEEMVASNLQYFYSEDEAGSQDNLMHFVSRVKEDVLLVILPAYERIFDEQTKDFMNRFSDAIFERRKYNYAAMSFSKRTVISGIMNLPTIYQTPNILHEDTTSFKGKPAILVAAGPSLDYEYENLRYIKENGLAYIFSVGSAINALLERNIYPDGACTYDPSVNNAKVFQRIKDKRIDSIPLIYGSTVGFETIQNYPGPLLHYLVDRDFVNPFYLERTDGKNLEVVHSAESIAIITLQLLYRLGCNPIILVGQNLGYTKDRYYASGSVDNVYVNEELMKKAHIVKDVEGNDMYTIKAYDSFRKEMESFIHSFSEVEVINTTKGGAHIAGTTYIPMDRVIEERLEEKNIVEHEWVDRYSVKYSRDFFSSKSDTLIEECEKLESIYKSFFRLFDQMKSSIMRSNKRELEKLFNKFDRKFDKLQANNFYWFFIQIMNHLDFDVVMKSFEEARFLKDPVEKAERVLEFFSNYLTQCRAQTQMMKPLLESIHTQVLEEGSDNGK
ncbi:hypothetical protein BRE01_12820 [Brevibacillus reuszeri]|uniref:6-hydroxymethylpterin diphosphokinase MptE-like domain-containing protein n=1 Tax=Brevibacillus reuszeri TaxID=54915 RepID=A0A0K9YTD2_9BACL|nr:6-hydroxymethylpterin diphosphokinase MptE-like protein [Brevibacillus reuszeri]KNB71897.1 hypothetical protein ADS79_24445 [Brevibacillus reuszeri]MED1855269.1 DUF115 domain-containing protein [Brevibacillus reuszeri]GED67580.1 hypothetical protein BRE01_12820 [Brevibacillus reuszeri]